MAGVRKTGPWEQTSRMLSRAAGGLEGAIMTALRQEAEMLRGTIVKGITAQAPGGQAFTPLSKLTLASRALKGRGGSKALIETASLRNSIKAEVKGNLAAFVGVPRSAQTKGGKSAMNIAQIHEFGGAPVIQKITPKMRRFLFALYRKAGIEPDTDKAGRGVVVHQIPPRPFLRPSFEQWKQGVRERFHKRVNQALGLPW